MLNNSLYSMLGNNNYCSRKTDKHIFTIEEHIIDLVQSHKYLGVILSNNGSFLNARTLRHVF